MPNTREKLIELLNEIQDSGIIETPAGFGFTKQYIENERIATHLITNGVTVQEWISVTERLPEEDIRVLVFTKEYIYALGRMDTDRLHDNRWVRWNGCVTHWMPLPEPPKGESL